jgi:hypothetical protein
LSQKIKVNKILTRYNLKQDIKPWLAKILKNELNSIIRKEKPHFENKVDVTQSKIKSISSDEFDFFTQNFKGKFSFLNEEMNLYKMQNLLVSHPLSSPFYRGSEISTPSISDERILYWRKYSCN